jgi:crotonobetaine/carnitine-CoA ligase
LTSTSTIPALVAARAEEHPDREFIKFQGGDVLSFGELEDGAQRVATGLLARDLPATGTIATMLPNCSEYLLSWAGALRAGMVETPVNVALRGDFLIHVLEIADCAAVIVHQQWLEAVLSVQPRLPKLKRIFVVAPDGIPPSSDAGVDIEPFDRLLDVLAGVAPPIPVDPLAPACLMFTSGTTGPSKGAVQSHAHCIEAQARESLRPMDYQPGEEVLFTPLPFFHTQARYATVLAGLLLPCRIVMHASFSATRFWDVLKNEEATAFYFIGPMLNFLIKQPERPSDRDHKVRKAFGAPAPLSFFQEFENRFGVRLCEGYGSTEIGPAAVNDINDPLPGSAGKLTGLHAVEIHDELGLPVAPGETGEVVVRPTRPGVLFDGYYGMAEATVQSWRNLWFHTGDRGRIDENGYFYFVDRVKDSIRRRGENISSWEVEKVVNSLDYVQEAAVIGVESAAGEEDVLLVVVLREKHTVTPSELLESFEGRIPNYAMPRYVRFVESLPKTPTGRIEKFKLRQKGGLEGDWDREAEK